MFNYTQVVHEQERTARILGESWQQHDRYQDWLRCGGLDLAASLPPPLPSPPNVSAEEFSAWLRETKYDNWKTPMTTTVTLCCPNCGAEIEAEVTINEEVDMPEFCETCGQATSPLYDEAQQEALEQLIEQSERMREP